MARTMTAAVNTVNLVVSLFPGAIVPYRSRMSEDSCQRGAFGEKPIALGKPIALSSIERARSGVRNLHDLWYKIDSPDLKGHSNSPLLFSSFFSFSLSQTLVLTTPHDCRRSLPLPWSRTRRFGELLASHRTPTPCGHAAVRVTIAMVINGIVYGIVLITPFPHCSPFCSSAEVVLAICVHHQPPVGRTTASRTRNVDGVLTVSSPVTELISFRNSLQRE